MIAAGTAWLAGWGIAVNSANPPHTLRYLDPLSYAAIGLIAAGCLVVVAVMYDLPTRLRHKSQAELEQPIPEHAYVLADAPAQGTADADYISPELWRAAFQAGAEAMEQAGRGPAVAGRPATPQIDPADWVATCEESDDHRALAFILRHRVDNQGAIRAFSAFRCTVTDPGGVTAVATGTALFYQYVPQYFPKAPPVRPGLYHFSWEGQDAKGAWHEITQGTCDIDPPSPPASPAITNRWRNTTNGFEVPGLMRIRDHSMSHPGYPPENLPPSVRAAMLVACTPLGPAPATSDIRASFLDFVSQQPISELLSAITAVPDDFTWTTWGDRPREVFGAVLNGSNQQAPPIAWARLLLPEDGATLAMHDPRCAELVLHIYPRAPTGTPAPAANLAAWHHRTAQALALPGALAHFLTHDLGLATAGEPLAQIGISLDTPHSITELVDTENIPKVAGTSAPTWFLAWAVADPDGQATPGLTRTWLTQMCDSTLNLNNYEPVLEALTNSQQPPPGQNA
jgi:hypothetical protein